ncbi:MAG: hypothetical protein ABI306_09070 [Caulobacteraceae bacterium]
MTDGINVDFGLLGKPPDFVGNYVNAFKVGQDLGKQTAIKNEDAGNAMTGEAGPSPAARIAAMSAQERARTGQAADLLAGLGQGLKGVPYTERQAVLAHLAPALTARGVPPAAIEGFDPTDDNLDAAVAEARSLQAMVATAG